MTGPAYGKLPLEGARIFLNLRELEGDVYVHLKGYALARVTHLDIEAAELGEVFPRERSGFYWIYGIESGLKVVITKNKVVKVVHSLLNEVLKRGEKTRTWVGGKEGGIYIGFRKKHVERLEKLAVKLGWKEAI